MRDKETKMQQRVCIKNKDMMIEFINSKTLMTKVNKGSSYRNRI